MAPFPRGTGCQAARRGHLVSEWALPTSQEAMAIKEVGWSVLIVNSEYRSFFFFQDPT